MALEGSSIDIYIPIKYICKHTKFNDSLYIKTRNKEPKEYDDIIGFGGYTLTCEDLYNYMLEEIRMDLFNAYLDMKTEEKSKHSKLKIKKSRRRFIK